MANQDSGFERLAEAVVALADAIAMQRSPRSPYHDVPDDLRAALTEYAARHADTTIDLAYVRRDLAAVIGKPIKPRDFDVVVAAVTRGKVREAGSKTRLAVTFPPA